MPNLFDTPPPSPVPDGAAGNDDGAPGNVEAPSPNPSENTIVQDSDGDYPASPMEGPVTPVPPLEESDDDPANFETPPPLAQRNRPPPLRRRTARYGPRILRVGNDAIGRNRPQRRLPRQLLFQRAEAHGERRALYGDRSNGGVINNILQMVMMIFGAIQNLLEMFNFGLQESRQNHDEIVELVLQGQHAHQRLGQQILAELQRIREGQDRIQEGLARRQNRRNRQRPIRRPGLVERVPDPVPQNNHGRQNWPGGADEGLSVHDRLGRRREESPPPSR